MIIRATREALIPVLTKVASVVERRQTLPILGNLLLLTRGDSVHVVASDLEIEVQTSFSADVVEQGEITIAARKFFDICRALRENSEISLSLENERAVLATGRSKFVLGTLPATDFPLSEPSPAEHVLALEDNTLKNMLERTSFAMAHQDVRYYLNGMLFEIHPDKLTAVATDGHRLAKVELLRTTGFEECCQVILPRKTVLELNRLLSGEPDSIQIELSGKAVRVSLDDTVLTSKIIDGRYPDYDRVVPVNTDKLAIVEKESFRQALLRAAILSNEKYRGVRLEFGSEKLVLQAHNPEQEEATEELDVWYQDSPVAMGFNVGYLLDVLNVLEGAEVEFAFTDSNSSAIIRNRGQEDETYVVMPMRL